MIQEGNDLVDAAPKAADNEVSRGLRSTRKQLLTAGALASALLVTGRRASATSPSTKRQAFDQGLDPRFNADQSGDTYDPAPHWTSPELRLVRRVTMGLTPSEVNRARGLGYEGYLEYQLNHQAIDDSAVEAEIAQRYTTIAMSSYQIASQGLGPTAQNQIIEATIYRAAYSNRQLFERMVEFWTDHFSMWVESAGIQVLKSADDRDVIRAHALGKFPDMLRASAHSAAMLRYLDQYASRADGGRRPNENYARELLELHTLGVDNGYTQNDVIEVAYCLTGWSYTGGTNNPNFGTFTYIPSWHSTRNKTVLGRTIIGRGGAAGEQEGNQVLDILISHPNTALYLALKMTRWLLQYEPSQELVNNVAQTYLDTGGDIKAMIRTILQPDQLMNAPAKFKRPYHLIVSALRSANPTITNFTTLFSLLRTQTRAAGQQPHYWQTPDGYPDSVSYWGSLILPRWNFGFALANNNLSGASVPITHLQGGNAQAITDRLDTDLFGGEMAPDEKDALRGFLGSGTPSQQRIRDAFGLALSSPNFQWY